jgi:DNA modification methylase
MQPQQILQLFNEKQVDEKWAFMGYKPSQTGKWTHGYHRYPAKFIPQLVEGLMEEYLNDTNAHVNDPFMGSGTTIVTAISKGFQASGTDINRISHLVTKVKAKPIEPTCLETKVEQFLSMLSFFLDQSQPLLFNINTEVKPTIPEKHIERIDYWFSEEHKNKLGTILTIIFNEEDETLRDFFLVAFSNILKNCSVWNQGSTKPTRDFKKKPANPYTAIRRHLTKMMRGNEQFYQVVPCRDRCDEYLNVQIGTAKKQPVPDNSVDFIISSSPYVTSYEYADLHQLSTIWLDLADDLSEYRTEFIGTSRRQHEKQLKSQIAENIVSEMVSKSPKKAREISAFFFDMEAVFSESFRILKRGGRCCYVIGNTRLKGVDILNAQVFAESLQNAGFKFDRIIKRKIPFKILPQKRDEKTGRFASSDKADSEAYPTEYIIIGLKE